jgi:predicted ATPase/tRNA A-37 threonylcarbamoyl transferase component Bud32
LRNVERLFLTSLESLQNGRYAILKKLGEGGKGVVFKARDTVLNRVVAIKMLKSAGAEEEAYLRFITEAQAVAKLNHPNIVSIHDIGREDEKQFFVLEFVDGESLRDLMQTYPEGKCDVQTVLRIGIDVCSALKYAHSQNILHRDIKPENVMITKEGVAKLMDFGLAKMVGQPKVTQEGVIVGTVAYVAPEIALGKGADTRSDLYSFGAVLYEAVAGRPPFPGDDPIKVIFSHIHDHPVSPIKLNPKVPRALVACITKLLEKEPAKRYQSAEDLLRALRETAEEFAKEMSVTAYKISVVAPGPRLISTIETQLVDRVEEMSLLREAVDGAVRGEGGLVFLCGEAGIGKTRLTRELGAYAHLRGVQVLYGRGFGLLSLNGVPPYVLWSEVVRDYLEACSQEQLYRVIGFYPAEIAKLVPELGQMLGTIPRSFPISPEHEQNRLFEAVSQFITNISREAPLMVVLDDLQSTDRSSLLLLHYLARGVHKMPLLLLGAYRSTEIDTKHHLFSVLTELNRERVLQSVTLKRMSLGDVLEIIKHILEQDDIPSEFSKLVYEKTRGNPFFVEEVMKSLKEEEVIYREEGKWKIKEVSSIDFPETVKSVIKNRISRLDDECQNVLRMTSFVGNDFTFEALSAVAGIKEDKLLEVMEKMLETGLVKERVVRGEDVYSFADAMIRDVVHQEVSHLRHKRLHGIVGCALEKAYTKKTDEHLGELAYHFLEGGDDNKALDYFLKAGEKAAQVYANSEAVSYLQSALRLLEDREGELRKKGRVLEMLGDIKNIVGEYDASVKYWNDALQLWGQLDEKEKVSRLHRKMANVLWDKMGDSEKAKDHHDKALKILETTPESVELASLYEDIAHMYYRTGNMDEAFSWGEKALELAKKLNAYDVVASSYVSVGTVLIYAGNPEKAIECLERGLKMALDHGYMETALRAYNNIALALPIEESERCLECYEKGLELAKKVGDIYNQSLLGFNLAGMYFNMGNIDKAVPMMNENVALDRKTGNTFHLYASTIALGYAYHILGEMDNSQLHFKEAMDISQRLDDFQLVAGGYDYLGQSHFDEGDYVKAKELFEKMNQILEKAGDKSSQANASQFLIWTYIKLGETKEAKNLIDSMYEFALQVKNNELIAALDALKAMLLRDEKKWVESIEHFEKSLQEFEAVKARRWNPYFFARMALCEYAQVFLERDQEGDREKAHKLLNQALEIFQKMGAKNDIEKVIAKKKLLTA